MYKFIKASMAQILNYLSVFYIKRLERGELDGEEEIISPRGEARDDISLLPRKVAIKVLFSLSFL